MAKTKRFSLADLEVPDLERIAEPVRKFGMRESVKLVAKEARKRAPVGRDRKPAKDRLRRQIRYSVRKRGLEGSVRAKARHAHLVHDGTKPHWIRSREGRVMVFRAAGRTVIARAVRHPGAKAQPFLDEALERSTSEIGRILAAAAREGINEALG